MKLDVVYPLSRMAKGPDDFELRYSLRSLDCQPWVGNVFIVGHAPPWLKNATLIPFADLWNNNFKDKNIIKKMLQACIDERVSDPFVANSDDQYWLKEIEPEQMVIPPRENPPQVEVDAKNKRLNPYRPFRNQWVARQSATVQYLKDRGKCSIYFDGHVPYLIEKEKYIKTMCHLPWEMGIGFLIVIYHGWNWREISGGIDIKDRDGVLVRIKREMECKEIEENIGDALFLNHNNRAFTEQMKHFLRKRFPDKSRWE